MVIAFVKKPWLYVNIQYTVELFAESKITSDTDIYRYIDLYIYIYIYILYIDLYIYISDSNLQAINRPDDCKKNKKHIYLKKSATTA